MNDKLLDGVQDSFKATAPIRKVQLFRAGPLQFGVFEEHVATIAQWRAPTPLPHAPESVLGVVSIQGRMLTLLDLARLCGGHAASADEPYRQIIALRGDEQLAIAASAVGESIGLPSYNSESETLSGEPFVHCVFTHAGAEIKILNDSELFAAAWQGRERRRRRF